MRNHRAASSDMEAKSVRMVSGICKCSVGGEGKSRPCRQGVVAELVLSSILVLVSDLESRGDGQGKA